MTPKAWFKDISGSWLCNQGSCYQQRKHSSLLGLGLGVTILYSTITWKYKVDHSFILHSWLDWYTRNAFTCSVRGSACIFHLVAMAQPRCWVPVPPHPRMICKCLLLVFIICPSCPLTLTLRGPCTPLNPEPGITSASLPVPCPLLVQHQPPSSLLLDISHRKPNLQNWQGSQNVQLCGVSLISVYSALCDWLWPQPHH